MGPTEEDVILFLIKWFVSFGRDGTGVLDRNFRLENVKIVTDS